MGDGSSWESAFAKVSEAVSAAPADSEIWVGGGRYFENLLVNLPCEIRGGFLGIEEDLSERVPSATPTILDATGLGQSVIAANFAAPLVLDRLTLTNGFGTNGGGLDAAFCGISLSGCEIVGNTAESRGGGIEADRSDLEMVGCVVKRNYAMGRGDGGGGVSFRSITPGVFNLDIRNCDFQDNAAEGGGSAISVDADRAGAFCAVQIEDSTMTGNRVRDIAPFSGVLVLSGSIEAALSRTSITDNTMELPISINSTAAITEGPLQMVSGTLRIEESEITNNRGMAGIFCSNLQMYDSTVSGNDRHGIFSRNTVLENCAISENGGVGVDSSESTVVRNSRIQENGHGQIQTFFGQSGGLNLGGTGTVENSRIEGNSANGEGAAGGIRLSGSRFQLINCAVVGNQYDGNSTLSTPGILTSFGEIGLTNCVLTENRNLQPNGFLIPEREGLRNNGSALHTITNTIIWEATRPLFGIRQVDEVRFSDLSVPFPGEGNISQDPLFLKPWDGTTADLRLPCHSPCIDAGTSETAPFGDIEGVRRPRGGGVDMGVYENCALDLSGDRLENGVDALYFPSEWYEPVNETNRAFDFVTGPSGTARIDSLDLIELIEGIGSLQNGQK
jgi:hypothetical protein